MDTFAKILKWWGIGFTIVFLSFLWQPILAMGFFVLIGFMADMFCKAIKQYIKKSKEEI